MNLSEKIKDQVIKSLQYDMSAIEIQETIDETLKSILEKYKPIIDLHESILNNKIHLNNFKDLIVSEIKKEEKDV